MAKRVLGSLGVTFQLARNEMISLLGAGEAVDPVARCRERINHTMDDVLKCRYAAIDANRTAIAHDLDQQVKNLRTILERLSRNAK